MKRIIICCDGTNNQLNGDLTNVIRLYRVALKNPGQVAFYDPGVGTIPDPVARTLLKKRWSLITGLAFGTGFDENVFDAYRHLMQVYEPGDQVFLFGFSRGAFTVRVLAGMLHAVGLLNKGTENLLPYAFNYYRAAFNPAGARVCADLKRDMSRVCPVTFLGVWDTVSSVGMYNFNQTYPFTYENPSVAQVRHAVSLDERRAGFRSNIFKADAALLPNGRQRVMNVWFPGVHSDIGGGYPWAQSNLAMISFQWMVREAVAAGMDVDVSKLNQLLTECPPNPLGLIHESLKGAWKLMELLPARRFDWSTFKSGWRWQPGKPRTILNGAILHESVLQRIQGLDYCPASLPKVPVADLPNIFPIEK
ncbi:MAG: hypothetical protein JWM68_5452 [Verrucomicrobiales bacterium]|nr:hypothetical protein [Verrucomicrobiales bacterium]